MLATARTAVTLTPTNWYTAKVVIDDDPGNSALQQLKVCVAEAGDGFGNDSAQLDTTAVDDVWSAGYAGLFMGSISAAQEFDDLKIGIDNNADGDAEPGLIAHYCSQFARDAARGPGR